MDEDRPPDQEPTPEETPALYAEALAEPLPRRLRLRVRRVMALLAAAVLAAAAAVCGYFYATNSAVRALTRTVLRGGLSPKRAFADRDGVTLLVLGRDVDIGPNGQVLDTPGRTDLILAVRMDFSRGRVVLLSIPRDLLVAIPGRSGRHKINAAHAYGGAELTRRTVAENLGIQSDYCVAVNYDAVAEAIDALGGVSVYVDQPMDYDDNWGNLHIHLEQGRRRLNGEQAVGFARFRKSNTGQATSDLKRIQRQHRLAAALAAELRQPRAWLRLPEVLETTRQGVATNLSFDQLACLAWTVARLPQDAMTTQMLPVRPTPQGLVLESDAPEDVSALLAP